jgi:hypothetical protein
MIAGQIPDDADGPKMVSLAQMQDLLDDFWRRPVGWVGIGFLLIGPASPSFL